MNKYGQTVGRNFLGRLNTGIHQSIQMAIVDKVLIDDFTQHVELFSSKEQQMTEEKYLHTEKDYLDLLLAVRRKFLKNLIKLEMSGKIAHKKMWGKSVIEKQKSLDFKAFPVVFRCPLQGSNLRPID